MPVDGINHRHVTGCFNNRQTPAQTIPPMLTRQLSKVQNASLDFSHAEWSGVPLSQRAGEDGNLARLTPKGYLQTALTLFYIQGPINGVISPAPLQIFNAMQGNASTDVAPIVQDRGRSAPSQADASSSGRNSGTAVQPLLPTVTGASVAASGSVLRRNPIIATLSAGSALLVGAWAYIRSRGDSGRASNEPISLALRTEKSLKAIRDQGTSVWDRLEQAYQDGGMAGLRAAEDKLTPTVWAQLQSQVRGTNGQVSNSTSEQANDLVDTWVASDPLGTDTLALGELKDWVATLVQALNAHPCEDYDGYINSPWRMDHPASETHVVSAWNERIAQVPGQVVALMQRDPSTLREADKAIADVYVSAMIVDAAKDRLVPFQPQLNAIAALNDKASIGRHICDGIADGRGALLGVAAFFGVGLLCEDLPISSRAAFHELGTGNAYIDAIATKLVRAGMSTGPAADHLKAMSREKRVAPEPSHPAAFYGLGANNEQCKAYIDGIAAQLIKTGMDTGLAGDHAKTIFDMEARLANASDEVISVNRADAQKLVPDFPWTHLWDQTFKLKPDQTLYVQKGFCEEIGKMLKEVSAASWRAFLTSQEARRAFPYMGIDYSGQATTPSSVYRWLNHHNIGQTAISDAYLDAMAPTLESTAQAMFKAVGQQYQDQIAASAFSDGDKRVLKDAIDSARFEWKRHLPDNARHATSSSVSYLENMQAMREKTMAARIDAIRADNIPLVPPLIAHEDMVGVSVATGEMRVAPASLHGLPMDREGQCATLGFIFGHEFGHLLNDARDRLSPAGRILLDRENEGIRQLYDGTELGRFRLNTTTTLEENSSDLRGLIVAYQVGLDQAAADGVPFDGVRFFEAYGSMAAANPTERQLEEMLKGPHAPPPVRVNTASLIKAFNEAFNCPPTARRPMDRIFGTAMSPASSSG